MHQIAQMDLQKCKIFQLLRVAHPPSDSPCSWRFAPTIPQCWKLFYATGIGKPLESCHTGRSGLGTPLLEIRLEIKQTMSYKSDLVTTL